jgi:hypothetical protein
MKFYDYIFYRIYKFRNAKISQLNSAFPSLALMSINITWIFMVTLYLFKLCIETDELLLMIKDSFLLKLLVPILILLLHLFYFFTNDRYKIIICKYDSINIDKYYKLKGFLVVLFVIFPYLVSFIFIFLGINGYL